MFKRHPKGLAIIFFAEMWERFGFYILMAIYVLYMDEVLKWDDARKGDFYGWFLGGVYFLPILGGWIGDRLFGAKNTIRLGAACMVLGYIGLYLSSVDQLGYFYAGLALIAFGTGIFKANMSVAVGYLYEQGSPLRDAGYNIYYMGVNIGAAIAPLVATWIYATYHSYNLSFAAAAVGMTLSLVIFQFGRKLVPNAPLATAQANPSRPAQPEEKPSEFWHRISTLFTLFLIVIFFWIAFYQNGFALTLFAQRSTIVSGILRPETYQFFNPFFILVLTPILISVFSSMHRKGKEPTSAMKIFLGMCVSGFAMVVMVFAGLAGGNADANNMSPLWLVGSYFIVTVAEILVSPMGLSFVSKVAPRKIQGLMMGFWFGATAVGSYGSGLIGKFYSDFPHHQYFMIIAGLLFFSAILAFVFMKRLNRFSN